MILIIYKYFTKEHKTKEICPGAVTHDGCSLDSVNTHTLLYYCHVVLPYILNKEEEKVDYGRIHV